MAQLRNKLSKEDCLKKLAAEDFRRVSISFYRYVRIEDPQSFRDILWTEWNDLGIFGRIYVSKEGINAQFSVPEHNVERLRAAVDARPELNAVPFKIGVEENGVSFWKLTIKVREHILAHGIDDLDMTTAEVGEHLPAESYNAFIENGATVVDMRNKYESDIGHFEGAVRPKAQTFREELPEVLDALKGKEEEPVLLYCTGGIRCEPTSAYLKQHGFKEVYQLNGGIIQYSHEVKEKGLDSKYIGKNFVFDGRRDETITGDVLGTCAICHAPSDEYIDCANIACHVMFIECGACQETLEQCCSDECKRVNNLPAAEQKALRRGKKAKFVYSRT
ncbi:MAG: rhodanese-related sulfurtransferase [bacterium]|nr:rhodanese-related sulfurtransferase [bacterium]